MEKPEFKSGRGYKSLTEPNRSILDPIVLKGRFSGKVTFKSLEFTSLCPVTDQPDWANIIIEFEPNIATLETKSLKLYLHAFRSYKGFAEAINIKILNDIFETIKPLRLTVSMIWARRGGIEIRTSFQR